MGTEKMGVWAWGVLARLGLVDGLQTGRRVHTLHTTLAGRLHAKWLVTLTQCVRMGGKDDVPRCLEATGGTT